MVFKARTGTASVLGGAMSLIGAEAQFGGNIVTKGDIHIDGAVEGDIVCNLLVLGEQGSVRGNIKAESARIAGTIAGIVDARMLTVDRTARIEGDLRYETVSIEMGAKIEGRVSRITGEADGNPLKLVSAGE